MDLSNLGLPKPSRNKARVQSSDLDPVTYYRLRVGSRLRNRSLAAQTQSLITAQVARWWDDWEEILKFEAAAAGKTPEELFVELALDGEEE
jgi:hypothetical protein